VETDKNKLSRGVSLLIGVVGLSLGIVFGLGIFIVTNWHVIKGENYDGSEPTAQKFIEKARGYARQNDTWNAMVEYKNAIQLDPENAIAYFELAETYVLLNSINEAIIAYQTATTINPRNKYAKLRLAQVYIETGKLLEARKIIAAILATDPQTIQAYHLLSSIQIREMDFAEAIQTLRKTLLISEKNVKTKLALASLYEASSKHELAKAMYKDILAIDSSLREPYMRLCKLYRKDEAWDKMEALLLQVIETPEIRETKLTDMAHFYEGRKKYSNAEIYYKRAVDESPQSIQAIMNLAEFHTRRNDRDKAIATMEKAVKLAPDNLRCLVGFAQIYLAFDMPEFSWREIDKAQKIEKNDLNAGFIEGKLLMKRGDFKGGYIFLSWIIDQGFINADAYHLRALCIKHQTSPDDPRREKMKKDIQTALLIEPNMLKSRIELIEIYLHEKNIAKAYEHLCIAFRQSPRNPRLLILLAALKFLLRNYDDTSEIYTAIVEQNPSHIPAHLRLALVHTASGKMDQAVRSYIRAYETEPQRLSILKKISDILVNEKRYKKAIKFLNSAKIPPNKILQAFVENLRGEIFLKAGEETKAMNSFQASTALNPAAIASEMNLARLFMDSKQMEKAKAIYTKVEKVKPDHLTMLIALGAIHDYQGDLKMAESYYRRSLVIDANHGYASNNLAYLLSETNGDTNEALALAGIALDKHHNDPNILDTMGWVYYRKGSYLYAILFFKESLALKPDNPMTCYHLGMALSKTDEFEKARPYFEKALSLNNDFKHAEEIRKMLKSDQSQ